MPFVGLVALLLEYLPQFHTRRLALKEIAREANNTSAFMIQQREIQASPFVEKIAYGFLIACVHVNVNRGTALICAFRNG